jgi:uncharacterized protein YndB with AHSA1/START domain
MSETTIEAVQDLPVIRITREFDAPAEKVFRAHTDPELFAQWIGPHSVDTVVTEWDARTGGHYAFRNTRDEDDLDTGFYGSFHEVRPNERIVQTFAWEGAPDAVSLETMTLEDLPGGRCRMVNTSVVETIRLRDDILASGMDIGVTEGYAKLDKVLAGL